MTSCYPILSISEKFGVNNRSSKLYFITLILAVLLLTMGFAQAGRQEKNSAIYRYSNSVWATLSPNQHFVLNCTQYF